MSSSDLDSLRNEARQEVATSNGLGWSKLGAVQSSHLHPGVDPRQLGGTSHLGLDIKTAAPAYIAADGEPAQLAQRHAAPLHLEIQWHLAQQGGPMQRAVDAQHAGVGKIEIEIGAHRLRPEVQLPLIREAPAKRRGRSSETRAASSRCLA